MSLPFPYGRSHSGCLAGKHSLQVLFYMPKRLLPKVPMAMAAMAVGLLWLFITLVILLSKLYSKHHPTPGQMFSEHPGCVAVYTNMFPKWASWLFDFPIGVLITNRTNSDLVQPSVHNPGEVCALVYLHKRQVCAPSPRAVSDT